MHHHYRNFSAHDFLTDVRFRKWVLSSDKSSDEFWQTFCTLYPSREKELAKARQILLQLHEARSLVSPKIIDEDWEKLRASITAAPVVGRPPHPRKQQAWLIAASVSLLLALGYFLWIGLPLTSRNTHTTAYGETRRLMLPDSSVVILNANSSLEYVKNWNHSETREVWLKGEAYFEVEEKEVLTNEGERKMKFVVHTPELHVQVVGTAFSVNSRQDKTQVTLNSGKVIIRDKQDGALEMEPGEQVELYHQDQKLVKKKVIPENYNSWKDNKLEFVNMPMPEILEMLQDRYGWRFEVQAAGFLNNRYKGSAPAAQPEVLLQKWELLYGLEIVRQDKNITIKE